MFRSIRPLLLVALLGPGGSRVPARTADVSPVVRLFSPNGQVRLELFLQRHQDTESVPHWRTFFHGRPIVLPSRLGVDLSGGASLGGSCVVESVDVHAHHQHWTMFPGKRRHVLDACSEAVVSLRERTPPGRHWELVLRAYNDGVAFRYRFPAQDGWQQLVIANARTEFAFPEDARAIALPLNSFTTPYEKLYQKKLVRDVPKDWLLGLPLLVECPGSGWAAITEANLTDYAGMYLASAGNGQSVLTSRLSPRPGEPKVAVKATLPHATPWRVVMLADQPGRLIESDLVLNLNEPCALADTSWIHPGKTTFPWWNGYHLEHVPFKPGLNTATMKYYIDFCAEAGIPYHSLDGLDNVAWYGGPIVPYRGADIIQGLPGLDLPEVIRYAKSKGVRLRIWMHWQAAKAHMDRAFPLYHKWGIEGVMLDFMDRDDQEMVNFLRGVLRKAAENHLTVTLHGMSKPTGLERTYPNLLTSEGVRNLEYDKWDKVGCPPDHQVIIPYTRMLAGPLDFHQGSFRAVPVAQFHPRNEAPLVMGTPTRTLASYVVYQNHLSMVADYPAAYRGHPALPMLVKIPTAWDDTKFLAGAVGEYVFIARRHGADWYVGGMSGLRARDVELPLKFLGPGPYRAEIFADDLHQQTVSHLVQHRATVTAQDVLPVQLDQAGGYFARLTPLLVAGPALADVFVPSEDGFKSISIPSVVVTKRGTVLAIAEGRAANADQAKNKLILKRSTDGGKTWGALTVIAQKGDHSLNNPCAVVERSSGLVLVMYQSYPNGISEQNHQLQPGYEGDRIVRSYLITSADDGATWSQPRDVTRETKREKAVTTVASGPGIGIQLRHGKYAGRILVPFNEGPFGRWNIYVVTSDDRGQTWRMGDVAPGGLIDTSKGGRTSMVNEAQVVELQDGSIRFNVRRWAGKPVRKTCVSHDGGATWSPVEDAPELRDPSCMASILRCADPADGTRSRLLYCGPQSNKRENGTVFLSYDEGKTWPIHRVLCRGRFGYSCLTMLPDGTIGCLYEAEGASKIVFARFTLDWLTTGKDRLEPKRPGPG